MALAYVKWPNMRTALHWLACEKVAAVAGVGLGARVAVSKARRGARPVTPRRQDTTQDTAGEARYGIRYRVQHGMSSTTLSSTGYRGDYSLSLGLHLRACASYSPSPTPPTFALCPAWLAPNASRLAQLASARDVKVA